MALPFLVVIFWGMITVFRTQSEVKAHSFSKATPNLFVCDLLILDVTLLKQNPGL